MKLRHLIAGALLSPFFFVAARGSALAQDAEDLPPAIAKLFLQIAILTDGVLNRWVDSATGNTLTDPNGQQLAADVAQVVVYLVDFLARLTTMF